MRCIAFAVLISLFSTLTAATQVRSKLDQQVDPFSIKRGSSFSASGGTGGTGSSNVSRLAADIAEAEQVIRGNYVGGRTVTADAMTKNALEGALRVLDPHSNFYDAREWADLLDEEQSGYSGIGATIANFERSGATDTYVLAVYPGSPAAKARLKFGDKIVSIDGENVTGLDTEDVRDKIRGALGSITRIAVERPGARRPEIVEIRRGRVPQPSIPDAYILRPGIGYIELSDGFNYTTYSEIDAALRELKRQGMRSLILDLRGNGGGIVEQAVKVAERFLPAGSLILSQKGRSRIDDRTWRSQNTAPETMPLVLLVDRETASASEILTGAFQDSDRALIVGTRTFGKGLVQSVIDLPSQTGLTLTTARYLTPSGRSIQRDYTKIDTYDYFKHEPRSSAIDKPMFAARTLTDRTVFGGDGILPDDVVKETQLTPAQIELIDPMFFYIRDLANGRVPGQTLYRNAAFGDGVSSVSEISVTNFVSYLTAGGWKVGSRTVAAESDFLKVRLRYYATLAAAGTNIAQRVLVEEDPQVARAVEALPRAAQLAKNAEQVRRGRR